MLEGGIGAQKNEVNWQDDAMGVFDKVARMGIECGDFIQIAIERQRPGAAEVKTVQSFESAGLARAPTRRGLVPGVVGEFLARAQQKFPLAAGLFGADARLIQARFAHLRRVGQVNGRFHQA
ncbi:MAG: hypothetical protein QOJ40_2342 [Verrucomicrobiota bacterium]